jgi:hypothetical protein
MTTYNYLGLFGLVGFKKAKLYFSRRNAAEKKISGLQYDSEVGRKKSKFKANIKLVKRDNSTQIVLIYKAKTFICKNL